MPTQPWSPDPALGAARRRLWGCVLFLAQPNPWHPPVRLQTVGVQPPQLLLLEGSRGDLKPPSPSRYHLAVSGIGAEPNLPAVGFCLPSGGGCCGEPRGGQWQQSGGFKAAQQQAFPFPIQTSSSPLPKMCCLRGCELCYFLYLLLWLLWCW